MEVQAVNFGYRFTNDVHVRQEYMRKTRESAENLRAAYKNGDISARDAAKAANQMRNEIMEFARTNSSDLGRAKAKALKQKDWIWINWWSGMPSAGSARLSTV